MQDMTFSEKYSELFEKYFDDSTLISNFPAINEINHHVKVLMGVKIFAELYSGVTTIKNVCKELLECKEYSPGNREIGYLEELDKLLTEAIENHNT